MSQADETDPFGERLDPGEHIFDIQGLGRVVLPAGMSEPQFTPGTSREEAFAAIRRNFRVIELPPPPEAKAPSEPGWGRGLGLSARELATGLGATVTTPADAVAAGVNELKRGFNLAVGRDADTRLPFQQAPGATFQQGLSAIGLPQAETPQERIVGAIQSGMTGGAGMQQLFKTLAQQGGSIAARLAQGPVQQAVGGATGGAAGAAAAEAGAGPWGQAGASLAGGMAGSIGLNPQGAVRASLTGGKTPEELRDTLKTFGQAGTTPDVAQLAESSGMYGLKRFFQRMPGSAGPSHEFSENQQSDLGAKVTAIAERLRGNTEGTPTEAGTALLDGLGAKGWKARFVEGERILHTDADRYVGDVTVSNFKNVLNELTATDPGAKNLTGAFTDEGLVKFREALKKDLKGVTWDEAWGGALGKSRVPIVIDPQTGKVSINKTPGQPVQRTELPASALKLVRSRIGEHLSDPKQLIDGPTTAQYKKLYGALSRDLEMGAIEADLKNGVGGATARNMVERWKRGESIDRSEVDRLRLLNQQSGQLGLPPETGPAFEARDRANAFSTAGHDLIDSSLATVLREKTPERAFAYATQYDDNMRLGATKLQNLLGSLKPEQANVVRSAFIDLMGKPSARQQGMAGDRFSSQAFLDSWNKMSPQARNMMFWSEDGQLIKDLSAVAKVADNIRNGYRMLPAPRNAAANAQALETYVVGEEVMRGRLATAATLLGVSALSGQITKRMFTNPSFVGWLAKATQTPRAGLPVALNALSQAVVREDQETQQDVAAYISRVKDTDRMLTKLETDQRDNNRHIYLLRDAIAR